MRKITVVITEAAETDILEIYRYIATHDSVEKAEHVLDSIEKVCAGLDNAPERGKRAPELVELGVNVFRQIFFKPYRIVYQIQEAKVLVFSVLDGRRNIEELLQERLLR